jgi:hypothetical protein
MVCISESVRTGTTGYSQRSVSRTIWLKIRSIPAVATTRTIIKPVRMTFRWLTGAESVKRLLAHSMQTHFAIPDTHKIC